VKIISQHSTRSIGANGLSVKNPEGRRFLRFYVGLQAGASLPASPPARQPASPLHIQYFLDSKPF
jgi:hypothetical protein